MLRPDLSIFKLLYNSKNMALTAYLNKHGYYEFEGHAQDISNQESDLIKLSSQPIINVMEIGFNAGHSADIFLKNNKDIMLTSFDLCVHNYLNLAKEYIDINYPNRHKLIRGNSIETVPKYIADNVGYKFDLIFIDGAHDYNTANMDLLNCMKLAKDTTIVILDDTIHTNGWDKWYTIDPTRVWKDNLLKNVITEINHIDYSIGRGMSWGRYIFN